MGYIHENHFSIEHRKKISEALKKKGIVPPSRKGVYKNDKPFDRKAYMKAYNSKKYAENAEVYRERAKACWRKRDVEKTKKRQREYQIKRNKTDIQFRLLQLFRKRTGMAIKKNYGAKAYKTIELLGCSIKDVRIHLEKQFKNGMTWENYGRFGWHIDHIIPISAFNLRKKEEQKKAFHYTNLQPLFWKENLAKGAKILPQDDSIV